MLGLMAEYGFKKPNQLAQALWSVLKSVIPDEYIDRRNEKVPNTPAVILTVLRAVKMLEGGATLSALRSQSINVEKLGIRSLPKARAKSADLTPAQIRRVIDAERAGATHAEIARVQPVGEGKIRDILREARGGKKPTL
jgi:hypothetical protein